MHNLEKNNTIKMRRKRRRREVEPKEENKKKEENEKEEEHVRRGVALHGEINIQVGTKNKECNNEWKNRARPDKNHNTKEDEE